MLEAAQTQDKSTLFDSFLRMVAVDSGSSWMRVKNEAEVRKSPSLAITYLVDFSRPMLKAAHRPGTGRAASPVGDDLFIDHLHRHHADKTRTEVAENASPTSIAI